MSTALPVVWTRELLLERAKFKPVRDVGKALRRTRQALNARTPKVTVTKGEMTWTSGGEPAHDIRLKAAKQVFELADVLRPREQQPDSSRPVNVTILIGDRAQGQVQGPSGYVLSLESTQQPALEAQGAVQAPDSTGNVQ